MRVEVQRDTHFVLERLDQFARSAWPANTGHVLDAQNMRAGFLQLLGHIHVIGQVVLRPAFVEEISRVADGALTDAAGFEHCIHRNAHVLDPVQRIEDAEDIHAGFCRLLDEKLDHVVRIIGVAHRIGRTQQHLQGNIRNRLAQCGQAIKRVFLEKTQRDVKGCAAPAFNGEQLRCHVRVVGRNDLHVLAAHARGKQRLVCVAHGGVGETDALFVLEPVGETLGAAFNQDVAGALGRRAVDIRRRQDRCFERTVRHFPAFHFRVAVDDDFANEIEQLGCAILARCELEQLRRGVNEPCRAFAAGKQRVTNHVVHEHQVGGQPANAELGERAMHARNGFIRVIGPGGDFHQQGIVIRGDDGACV